MRVRKVSREMIGTARDLRRRMTPAEERLWEVLRQRDVTGFRVRRQHPAGRYVLDFWIPAAKLAIELDGTVHDSDHAQAQDAERSAWFEAQGIRVLRFRNEAILHDLDRVLTQIQSALAVTSLAPPAEDSNAPKPERNHR